MSLFWIIFFLFIYWFWRFPFLLTFNAGGNRCWSIYFNFVSFVYLRGYFPFSAMPLYRPFSLDTLCYPSADNIN